MLSKTVIKARPSVLWCYKKELGFSSHRKKRMKSLQKKVKSGKLDVNEDDPFELFVVSTNIRYCYYHETHKILGNTYGMCVLQVRLCVLYSSAFYAYHIYLLYDLYFVGFRSDYSKFVSAHCRNYRRRRNYCVPFAICEFVETTLHNEHGCSSKISYRSTSSMPFIFISTNKNYFILLL